MKKYILILLGIFFVVNVFAIDWCCIEDNSGLSCQNYDATAIDDSCSLENQLTGVSCESSDLCDIGCCVSDSSCSPGTYKRDCNENWIDDPACSSQAQCIEGCCIIEGQSNTAMTIESQCNQMANLFGSTYEFNPTIGEQECSQRGNPNAEGACLVDDTGGCQFTTYETCQRITSDQGEFYQDYLCSHPDLNTNCEKQNYTSCLDGKDEVYWFDSCGNVENIYNSDKVASWNEGRVLEKRNSCSLNLDLSNAGSCGNCDYIEGSLCGVKRINDVQPDEGEYICRDLSCIDEEGNIRTNGEAWCDYPGSVEDGKAIPGTRHILKKCIDGEVRDEFCADRRAEVCIQGEDDNGKNYASCQENRWQECIELNTLDGKTIYSNMKDLKENLELCEENPHCFISRADLVDNEAYKQQLGFVTCSPKWPPGFDLSSESGKQTAEEVCELGSMEMRSRNQHWVDSLNDMCVSLGDCGGYVNMLGVYTDDGYTIDDLIIKNQKEDGLFGHKDGGGALGVASPVAGALADQHSNTRGTSAKYTRIKSWISSSKIEEYKNNLLADNIIDEFFLINPDETWMGLRGLDISESIRDNTAIPYFTAAIRFRYGILKEHGQDINSFKCLPWLPPDENNCSVCDELGDCTKYSCWSLGKNCVLENEDTPDEICFEQNPNDVSPPIITLREDLLKSGISYNSVSEYTGRLRDNSDPAGNGCLEAYSELDFQIDTNEPSQCKIGLTRDSYDDMSNYMNDSSLLKYNHSDRIRLPSVEAISYLTALTPEEVYENYDNQNYYIKCEDSRGNSNGNAFVISVCLRPEEDRRAPIMNPSYFSPLSDSWVEYGETSKEVIFYTNEPAECSYVNLIDESDVKNINCLGLGEGGTRGFRCNMTLRDIIAGSNEYEITCKDKPWETDESKRFSSSVNYLISGTETPLDFEIVRPSETEFSTNNDYFELEILLRTSGGVEGDSPLCSYNTGNGWNAFMETDSEKHIQIFNGLPTTIDKIDLKCVDEYNNEIEKELDLNISLDEEEPMIIRVYNEGGTFVIITDEIAECRYSERENKNWVNKTEMYSQDNVHTFPWKTELYNIECRDTFNNTGDNSRITVRTY